MKLSILHVCGDDPKLGEYTNIVLQYSPRMWRWSLTSVNFIIFIAVFSTYVEMILPNSLVYFCGQSILHVCGDDPSRSPIAINSMLYSPRMWRWSFKGVFGLRDSNVFSTYVEMILSLLRYLSSYSRILHVCGDDPLPITLPEFL